MTLTPAIDCDDPGELRQNSKSMDDSQSDWESDSSYASPEAASDALSSPESNNPFGQCPPSNIDNVHVSCTNESKYPSHPQPSLSDLLRYIEPKLWGSQSNDGRRLLLDEIISLIDIWLAFRQKNGHTSSETDGDQQDDPPPSSNEVILASSSSAANQPVPSGRKRNRLPDDDGDAREDGDDSGGGSKRPRASATEVLRFACPFRKRFPLIYGNKKHCLGWWPNVHRLKLVPPRKQPISTPNLSVT